MKRIFPFLFLCVVLGFAGCAYFNTFYNAKKYYNKAYRAVEKNKTKNIGAAGSVNKGDFQKSIDRCLKLLDLYPNSKWVDDALLLLGKSYYYQEEYLTAQRRFQELLDRFPQSELRFDAELGMAKTYVVLKQFEKAEETLSGVAGQKITKKQTAEAYFYQGKFFETKKEFRKAVDSYEKVLKTNEESLKIDAQYAIGDNYDSLRVYDQAAKAFRQVLKLDPSPEIRFDAEFRLAVVLKNNGEYDEAVKILERLLGDEKNKSHEPEMRLEVADCLARKGDLDGAIITYRDVIKLKEKTDYSAKAYYALGNIYETRRRDYDRALDNYLSVKKENTRSTVSDSAEIKGRDILRMRALQNIIEQAIRGGKGGDVVVAASKDTVEEESVDALGTTVYAFEDSLVADSLVFVERLKNDPVIKNFIDRETSFGSSQPADTTDAYGRKYSDSLRRMGVFDWRNVKDFELKDSDFEKYLERAFTERKKKRDLTKLAENPELKSFKKEELDKNLFLLGELYLFRFSMPDSALTQYEQLESRFPKSPYALQSLYNIHYIFRNIKKDTAGVDSAAQRIIKEYPSSPYAKELRKELGLRNTTVEEDTLQQLFAEAEKLLFDDKNPQAAISKYQAICQRYPQSESAPKAFYSTAWVYENALDSLRLAFVLYDSLVNKYPDTPFAEKVRKKVEAVKEEERNAKSKMGANLKQPVLTEATAGTSSQAASDSIGTTVPRPQVLPASGETQKSPLRESGSPADSAHSTTSPEAVN
jgi:TolA-binding protein